MSSTDTQGSGMPANPASVAGYRSEPGRWEVYTTVDITDQLDPLRISVSMSVMRTDRESSATGMELDALWSTAKDLLSALGLKL